MNVSTFLLNLYRSLNLTPRPVASLLSAQDGVIHSSSGLGGFQRWMEGPPITLAVWMYVCVCVCVKAREELRRVEEAEDSLLLNQSDLSLLFYIMCNMCYQFNVGKGIFFSCLYC